MAGVKTSHTTVRRESRFSPRDSVPTLRLVYSPDDAVVGAEMPLDGRAEYVFGRSSDASHRISDERMSRQHFRIEPGEASYLIEDLGSTNGTFLDGRVVQGRLPLAGRVIAAGDTLFVIDPVPDFDALPSAPGTDGGSVAGIVGASNAMRALRASVATVAPTRGGVLLLGPTGAGKEVTARAIHECSGRRGPFVAVNCAAIPEQLAEAELFGFEKGAFTGAEASRRGAFREASGGTLFLDEVGDLPTLLQPKLLRVLESSVVQPVGGREEKVDIRVVAATHLDLEESEFRRDLLARLCDWVLHLPALAERKVDVIDLFHHFLESEGAKVLPADPELYEAMLVYDWPMNVRELRSLTRRLVTLTGPDQRIDFSLLPAELKAPIVDREIGTRRPSTPRSGSDSSLDDGAPSREILEAALGAAKGNVKLAAATHGWHRTQLYRWLRRRDIDPARFR